MSKEHPKIVYSMEWSLGAEFWSGVLEWIGVKFWSGKSSCSLLIKWCILWSGVLERSIGVDWSQILERSAVVMCVYVCCQVLCNLLIMMDQ